MSNEYIATKTFVVLCRNKRMATSLFERTISGSELSGEPIRVDKKRRAILDLPHRITSRFLTHTEFYNYNYDLLFNAHIIGDKEYSRRLDEWVRNLVEEKIGTDAVETANRAVSNACEAMCMED